MKKRKTIKYKSDSIHNYQFGGLNLPFLKEYDDINKKWGAAWRNNPWSLINSTVKEGNWIAEKGTDGYSAYTDPNSPFFDIKRFQTTADKDTPILTGPAAGTIIPAGSTIYNQNYYQSQYNHSSPNHADYVTKLKEDIKSDTTKFPTLSKEDSFKNHAGGIFAGLNYLNAYKEEAPIYLNEGDQGVMYGKYGANLLYAQVGNHIPPTMGVSGPEGSRIIPAAPIAPITAQYQQNEPIDIVQYLSSKGYQFPQNFKVISSDEQKALVDAYVKDYRIKLEKENAGKSGQLYKQINTPLAAEVITTKGDVSAEQDAWYAEQKRLGRYGTIQYFNGNAIKIEDDPGYKAKTKGTLKTSIKKGLAKDIYNKEEGGNVNLTGYTQGTPTANNPMNIIPSGNTTMQNVDKDLVMIVKDGPHKGTINRVRKGETPRQFGDNTSIIELPVDGIQEEPMIAQFGKNVPKDNKIVAQPYWKQASTKGTDAYGLSLLQNNQEPPIVANTTPAPVAPTETSSRPDDIRLKVMINSKNVISKPSDPYEYKSVDGQWQTRKRGVGKWITVTDPAMTSEIDNYFIDQSNGLEIEEGTLGRSSSKKITKAAVTPSAQDMINEFNSASSIYTSTSPLALEDSAPLISSQKGRVNRGSAFIRDNQNLTTLENTQLESSTNVDTTMQKYIKNAENNSKKYLEEILSIEKDEWLSPRNKEIKIKTLKDKLLKTEQDIQRFQKASVAELAKQKSKNENILSKRASLAEIEKEKMKKEAEFKMNTIKGYNDYITKIGSTLDNYDKFGGEDKDGYKPLNQEGDRILKSNKGQYKLKLKGKIVDKVFNSKEEVLAEIKKRTASVNTKYGNSRTYTPTYSNGGIIPLYEYGGLVSNEHSYPVDPVKEEFTELQAEKGENAYLPDGTIVDVKATEKHKNMDRDDITDILPADSYVFSDTDKMKINLDTSFGGVKVKDMKLGKSVFEYKENQITTGPKDIMFSDIFNGKEELTPAEIANNIKKKFELRDNKHNFLTQTSNERNREQRILYLDVLKAFSEYKKPKSKREPMAQYGMQLPSMNVGLPNMYNQETNNGVDGMLGYNTNSFDPYKKMDNNIKSMYNISSAVDPKLYADGGEVEHAQLGKLLRYTSPVFFLGSELMGNNARKKQQKENDILSREAQGYRDTLQQGVDRAGGIGVGTNLATYAAALNVPDFKYNDLSGQYATMQDSFERQKNMLNSQLYTGNNLGSASSLARYTNPSNMGSYLAAAEAQNRQFGADLSMKMVDLENRRAGTLSSIQNSGYQNYIDTINNKKSQLYNANVTGLGNVGRAAQEATYNTANTKYVLGNEKMAYDAYLKEKAQAAKDKVISEWEGSLDAAGQIGITALTGGFGALGGTGGSANADGVDLGATQKTNMYNQIQGMRPSNSIYNYTQNIEPLSLLSRNQINSGVTYRNDLYGAIPDPRLNSILPYLPSRGLNPLSSIRIKGN